MERHEFPSLYRPNGAIYVTIRKNQGNKTVNLTSWFLFDECNRLD